MTLSPELEQVARLRPLNPETVGSLVSNAEREYVLDSIMSSTPERRAHRHLYWGIGGICLLSGVAAFLVVALVGSSTPVQDLPSTAYVLSATEHALSNTKDVVEIVGSATGKDGYAFETWVNPANQDNRTDYQDAKDRVTIFNVLNSKKTWLNGKLAEPTFSTTSINYLTKTWLSGTNPFNQFSLSPATIVTELRSGSFRIISTQTIRGVKTLELDREATGIATTWNGSRWVPDPGIRIPTGLHLWVDATTYLPVQGSSEPQVSGFPPEGRTTWRYYWFPPTPERLKEFKATIPPGFTGGEGNPPIFTMPLPG